VRTDAAGVYSISGAAGTWVLRFTADGFVDHGTFLPVTSARTGIDATLIAMTAPFSLDYYRQLVRGSLDHAGQFLPLARWTQAPKFFFRTTDQRSGISD
jgi:hypothetical protein